LHSGSSFEEASAENVDTAFAATITLNTCDVLNTQVRWCL